MPRPKSRQNKLPKDWFRDVVPNKSVGRLLIDPKKPRIPVLVLGIRQNNLRYAILHRSGELSKCFLLNQPINLLLEPEKEGVDGLFALYAEMMGDEASPAMIATWAKHASPSTLTLAFSYISSDYDAYMAIVENLQRRRAYRALYALALSDYVDEIAGETVVDRLPPTYIHRGMKADPKRFWKYVSTWRLDQMTALELLRLEGETKEAHTDFRAKLLWALTRKETVPQDQIARLAVAGGLFEISPEATKKHLGWYLEPSYPYTGVVVEAIASRNWNAIHSLLSDTSLPRKAVYLFRELIVHFAKSAPAQPAKT